MLMDHWFLLVLFSFAAFRLTRLLVYDKITAFIRAPFIEEIQVPEEDGSVSTYMKLKGSGLQRWIGELLSCYWCTGVWVTAFLLLCYYMMPKVAEPLLLLLGVAGIAAIIETIVGKLTEEN
ncbi:DUF1360 domain-containing protein [Ectobacillus ponti]|uniref:DUF1360 domain-containing protein n=1 Tax=Ectobacillus ponti TaxID=2961894 RepID=A0AA41X443_9BACI|nr:DUF1360 domain-containing protein [Ectobacillus ponti]MCP8968357.1 DUF1360 domain-containing protein [Ectobacillus ponti]